MATLNGITHWKKFSWRAHLRVGGAERERPRKRWFQDIGEWLGVSTVEAGRQALERGEFRQAVWEATSIKDPP